MTAFPDQSAACPKEISRDVFRETSIVWVSGVRFLVASIVLAYLFLKERMTLRKWIGTALAVAGSVLVALS